MRAGGRGKGGGALKGRGAVKGRGGWVRKNQINGPPAADRQTTRPVYFSTAADRRLKRSRHMTWIFTSWVTRRTGPPTHQHEDVVTQDSTVPFPPHGCLEPRFWLAAVIIHRLWRVIDPSRELINGAPTRARWMLSLRHVKWSGIGPTFLKKQLFSTNKNKNTAIATTLKHYCIKVVLDIIHS